MMETRWIGDGRQPGGLLDERKIQELLNKVVSRVASATYTSNQLHLAQNKKINLCCQYTLNIFANSCHLD